MTVCHHGTMAYGGLLHQNLAQPIIEISKQHQVSFVAFVSKAEGKNRAQSNHPHSLCINVYGAKDASGSVGDVLDNAGIYLQHPLSDDLAVPYINPHYLVRPNGSHPSPALEHQPSAPSRSSLSLSSDERLKSSVLQAMDNSAQGPSDYSYITPSAWIRTPLKP